MARGKFPVMLLLLSGSGVQAIADVVKDMPHLTMFAIDTNPFGNEGRLGAEASWAGMVVGEDGATFNPSFPHRGGRWWHQSCVV